MQSERIKDPNDPAVTSLITMMDDLIVEQRDTRKALQEILGPETAQECEKDDEPSGLLDMLRGRIIRARRTAQDIKVSVGSIVSAL